MQSGRYKFQSAAVAERCSLLAARIFKAAGAAALFDDRPFGRLLADINAARQHIANQYETHVFRTSAASTAATRGGNNPHLGSAILNHTDVRVTNEHYNRATSFSAAESLRQLIRQNQKNDY